MKFNAKILIFFLFLTCLLYESANAQSKTVRNAEKRKQEIEQRQKKAYEKAREKSIKDKFEMQTEATQKQIKESHKRAKKYNNSDKLPFIERLFKRKKRPKH